MSPYDRDRQLRRKRVQKAMRVLAMLGATEIVFSTQAQLDELATKYTRTPPPRAPWKIDGVLVRLADQVQPTG